MSESVTVTETWSKVPAQVYEKLLCCKCGSPAKYIYSNVPPEKLMTDAAIHKAYCETCCPVMFVVQGNWPWDSDICGFCGQSDPRHLHIH